MDHAGGVPDAQALQTPGSGHWATETASEPQPPPWVDQSFTQDNVSAGTHVLPPLLHHTVRARSHALVEHQAEGGDAAQSLQRTHISTQLDRSTGSAHAAEAGVGKLCCTLKTSSTS